MRYVPRRRLALLAAVNALILLHIIAYYVFGQKRIGCIDFFGLATLAGLGKITAGSLLLVSLVVLTLLLGRVFCGWGCHFAFFQDGLVWLLNRVGFRVPFRRSRLEYVIPPILFIVTLAYPIIAWWRVKGVPKTLTADLSYPEVWYLLPGLRGVALMLAIDVVALTLLFGSRAFCRYVCPYGLLLKPLHALSPVRVTKVGDCSGCGSCARACPTGVPIKFEVETFGVIHDLNCMNCGDCVAACPTGALAIRPTQKAYTRAFERLAIRMKGPLWVDIVLLFAAVLGLIVFRGREYGDFLAVALGLTTGVVVVAAIRPEYFVRLPRRPALRWSAQCAVLAIAAFLACGLVGQTIGYFATHNGERCLRRGDYEAMTKTYAATMPAIRLFRPFTAYLDDFADRRQTVADQVHREADRKLQAGDNENAALLYRALLSVDRRRVATYGDLGTAFLRNGQFWEAAACYLRVLESDPNDLVALYHLAMTRIQLKQNDDAVALVQRILEIDTGGNAYELIQNNPLFRLLEGYPSYRRSMSTYALVHPSSGSGNRRRETP